MADEVLRLVLERLGAVCRIGDTVARLGGDEFLVVAEQVVDLAESVALGERIVDAVGQPGRHSSPSPA